MMTWDGGMQTFTVWSAEQETILPSSLEKLQQYTTSVCPVIDSSSLPEWLSHTLNKTEDDDHSLSQGSSGPDM